MKQIATQKFVSEDNKFMVLCENDLSLGKIHDYLLEIKGQIVEMISTAQKQEQAATDAVKAKDAEKAEKVVEEVEVEEVK